MEAIFFAVDIVGVIWLLYWAIINNDRKPGTPTTGLFAYRETVRHYPPAGKRPSAGSVGRPPAASPTAAKRRPPAPPRSR